MHPEILSIDRQLRQETLFARERVYRFGSPTPIERLVLSDKLPGPEIWVKREDLSPVKSYKWRGACNRMAIIKPGDHAAGVVTASAGNHAQGVALAGAGDTRTHLHAALHSQSKTKRGPAARRGLGSDPFIRRQL